MLESIEFAETPHAVTAHRALAAIRKHLGMEAAFITEFVGDRSVVLEVDAPGLEDRVVPGSSLPLSDLYCLHILSGRLPHVICDAANHPVAREIPFTAKVPVGAYMSVPVLKDDGSILGMFCCMSPRPNPSLNDRDLNVMRALADIAGKQIASDVASRRIFEEKRARVTSLLAERQFGLVFQPIWDFAEHRVNGFEVLCRFTPQPYRSPDKWFKEAADVGMGPGLEGALLAHATSQLARFPARVSLSINASAETILNDHHELALEGLDLRRVVLEITEHAPVSDYARLLKKLEPFRVRGLRLAIDDAGAGYSSLQHILHLQPDIIKLDMSLTREIDIDPARQALASALIYFGRETGSVIVAEGIETEAELEALRALGVTKGQGYLLGRPVEFGAASALLHQAAGASTG